jgi:hypothetical protein
VAQELYPTLTAPKLLFTQRLPDHGIHYQGCDVIGVEWCDSVIRELFSEAGFQEENYRVEELKVDAMIRQTQNLLDWSFKGHDMPYRPSRGWLPEGRIW